MSPRRSFRFKKGCFSRLYSDTTPSGHTCLDGPTKIVDLEKTVENKDVVRNLIQNFDRKGYIPSEEGTGKLRRRDFRLNQRLSKQNIY